MNDVIEMDAFVASLPVPTADQVNRYDNLMNFLLDIRRELNLDQPVCDDTDYYPTPHGKYCDHSYAVSR